MLKSNILCKIGYRYLPESMLIERSLKSDVQVTETAKMLKDGKQFDSILARDKIKEDSKYKTATTLNPKEILEKQ
jgi:hypothetical protein